MSFAAKTSNSFEADSPNAARFLLNDKLLYFPSLNRFG
jgi:hypothetical protein